MSGKPDTATATATVLDLADKIDAGRPLSFQEREAFMAVQKGPRLPTPEEVLATLREEAGRLFGAAKNSAPVRAC